MSAPDVWGKLWDMATSEPGGPATITPDPEDPGYATLTWPDGSNCTVYWHDGDWRFPEAHNACPGDVAARDAL